MTYIRMTCGFGLRLIFTGEALICGNSSGYLEGTVL
jgi:hypothetical protein